MKSSIIATPATLAVMIGLAACATTDGSRPDGGICRPADAAALVGSAAPDDGAILHRTGSSMIRRIAPGDMTTKDFRQERVTVTVANGKVVAAFCG